VCYYHLVDRRRCSSGLSLTHTHKHTDNDRLRQASAVQPKDARVFLVSLHEIKLALFLRICFFLFDHGCLGVDSNEPPNITGQFAVNGVRWSEIFSHLNLSYRDASSSPPTKVSCLPTVGRYSCSYHLQSLLQVGRLLQRVGAVVSSVAST
jgi:hypothetical protein